MNNHAKVVIDTSVLVQPALNCSKEEADEYKNTIYKLNELTSEPLVTFYLSKDIDHLFFDDEIDLFPNRKKLDEIFTNCGIRVEGNDIVSRIYSLLGKTSRLDDALCDLSIIEVDRLTTKPDIISLESDVILRNSLEYCIKVIAFLGDPNFNQFPHKNFVLMLRNNSIENVSVTVNYKKIYDDANIEDFSLDKDIPVCSDIKGIYLSINEALIFLDASKDMADDGTIEFVAKIAWYRDGINNNENPSWDYDIKLSANKNFRKQCKKVCGKQDEKFHRNVLKTIVNAVNRNNLGNPHPVKESGQDNVRGNGDKLMRRDITDDAHLHYWEGGSSRETELHQISSSHDQNLRK